MKFTDVRQPPIRVARESSAIVQLGEMIERHRDGIAAYCKPENEVALGFVEGLSNKIRVVQRRAYGLRDEEHLRLKGFMMMLPPI